MVRSRAARKHPEGIPVRRASMVEAANARAFIEAAFSDRVSWVAARVLLERVRTEMANGASDPAHPMISIDLGIAIDTFLERHPAKPVPILHSAPQAGVEGSETAEPSVSPAP
jgi:hypothetical protein